MNENNTYEAGTDNSTGAQGNYQQNNYQQPQYQQGYTPQYQQPQLEEPISMSEWLITMLIMMVPCVNIVMMFVWAFSKTERKSKANYFKAQLIFMGAILLIYLVIFIIFGAAIAASLS